MNGHVSGRWNEGVEPVDRSELRERMGEYRGKGYRILTMTGTDERLEGRQFALYWVLTNDREGNLVTLRTDIPENDPQFPSVTRIFPGANWYEREVRDLLGLKPVEHVDPRPLVLHGDWSEQGYPLRKDYRQPAQPSPVVNVDRPVLYRGEGIVEVPVGPIHAGIIEPGHFRFGTLGDHILHLDPRLFYTHRGLEKKAEGRPVDEALQLAERSCGVCAASHAVSFSQAVERIAGAQIPERAEGLRVIILEMERMYNHAGDLGNICAGLGFAFGVQHGARLKERLMQINEELTGHRYLRGVIRPGGVDMNPGDSELYGLSVKLKEWMNDFRQVVETTLSHDGTVERMGGTGKLHSTDAMEMDVVGPAARASGIHRDIRRDFPYGMYRLLQLRVPLYKSGDVLARYRVRIEELEQAYRLIREVMELLPKGDTRVQLPRLDEGRWGIGWSESPRGDNVHWVLLGENQRIARCRIRSASYVNWPAVPLAVEGNIVPDFPLINKSFELCYACCER